MIGQTVFGQQGFQFDFNTAHIWFNKGFFRSIESMAEEVDDQLSFSRPAATHEDQFLHSGNSISFSKLRPSCWSTR
jgi:hypothetical protein